MRTIRKYTLSQAANVAVEMPINAEIISAKSQNDAIVIYAIVESDQKVFKRRVIGVYSTGWDITYNRQSYIDTVMMPDGLVFHVFEILD